MSFSATHELLPLPNIIVHHALVLVFMCIILTIVETLQKRFPFGVWFLSICVSTCCILIPGNNCSYAPGVGAIASLVSHGGCAQMILCVCVWHSRSIHYSVVGCVLLQTIITCCWPNFVFDSHMIHILHVCLYEGFLVFPAYSQILLNNGCDCPA